MKVTDLDYHLETRLVEKIDLMVKRCTNKTTRKDAVLICEGSEGEGKTNSSEAIAYYIKHKTKRDIHMFFRLKHLIEFAKSTEEKIIIWDEPALDSLSSDWWKGANKDLIRLLMTCRKKRHFFIFNFVKFYKFSEYVVVDRSLGLIHMYSRKGTIPGRFIYIKKGDLENLFRDYRQKKKREYKKYARFGGGFPIVEKYMAQMGITIEGKKDCTLEDYEKLKDRAIESIGGTDAVKVNKFEIKYDDLRRRVASVAFPVTSVREYTEKLGITRQSYYNWAKLPPVDGKSAES